MMWVPISIPYRDNVAVKGVGSAQLSNDLDINDALKFPILSATCYQLARLLKVLTVL